MSKIALTPNASGTGTLTIAAPNTSIDRTLTLPDSTGTIDTLGRAGNVLQVVTGNTTTAVSTTSSSWTDTTLSASITPSSSSNKVLIIISQGFLSLSNAYGGLKILRGSTDLFTYGYATNGPSSGGTITMGSFQYLDSPSTTSAVTYKTQFNASNSGNTVVVQQADSGGDQYSWITLMEIAA